MEDRNLSSAILAGAIQGIVEWLPISSEGHLSVLFTAFGRDPEEAINLSLFMHLGTAISALIYYRNEVANILQSIRNWSPKTAFNDDTAELSFLSIAFSISFGLGLSIYHAATNYRENTNQKTDDNFIPAIGSLLIITGLIERFATRTEPEEETTPTLTDAILTGVMQGISILPGISRSGATTNSLLLRGYDGPDALRLSFLLSIPASIAAGIFGWVKSDGMPETTAREAGAAITTSAIVGYLTIDTLTEFAEENSFWKLCVGFGTATIFSGVIQNHFQENNTESNTE